MVEVLLVKATRIKEVWPSVVDGIQKAIDESYGYVSSNTIYHNLLVGAWILWLVVEDQTLLGVAITETLDTEQGAWCNIPFAYSVDPKRDVHKDFLSFIEELAKKNGYVGVKFISRRPGYKRKAERLGYEVGFVEFRKPFYE